MITFSSLGRHGRLGNQLFQYAALVGISEKLGIPCGIPRLDNVLWHGQGCLLNNFNLEAKTLTLSDLTKISSLKEEIDPDIFQEAFFYINDGYDIKGFFQNTKYFAHCEDRIRREFTPTMEYKYRGNGALAQHRRGGYEIVSIHIRRGDMMDFMERDTGVKPEEVFDREDIFSPATIYGDYLCKAMDLFKDRKVKYYVFAGGSRTGDDAADIAYIKKMFSGDQFIISHTNNPMLDFVIMSACDHNITCHQSTFGWWAAYLNKHPNKIVIAPKHYFFLMSEEQNYARTKDGHFPDDWTIIE